MSEIKITVTAPEITEAINNLANAIRSGAIAGGVNLSASPDTTAEAAIPNPANPGFAPQTATAADTQTNVGCLPETSVNPASVAAAAAVPVAPTSGQAVPTAAPQYTLEMIAKAGTVLIDAGKMNELTALLARYGVEALTALDPAHYGTFANELRALGASI